jgi:hypothetical protein
MVTEETSILKLMHGYAHKFDDADFEGFAQLFSRGTLEFRGLGPPMIGPEAVLSFIRSRVILYDGRPCTNHLMHNALIDVAPDGKTAAARSYVQILQSVPDFPIQTIGTGRYLDRFAADEGGWHFVERVGIGSLRGDFSRHLQPA